MTILAAADADIVILGATPAGITAAIAAARRNKTSVIVERTRNIGGLPANGLGATDIKTRGATGGLFLEFVGRVKAHYIAAYGSQSQQVRDCSGGYHFEPAVAEKVFNEWLNQYGKQIQVLTDLQFDFEPENLYQRDREIKSIRVVNRRTGRPEIIRGRFFLDCTYEGDLMAAAGVPFLLGRESKDDHDEIGAGRLYKRWNGSEGPGSTHVGDNAVQSYNYRICMTDDPANRVTVRKPENYRREEFVSLINDVKLGRHTSIEMQHVTEEQLVKNYEESEHTPPVTAVALGGINRLLSNIRLPNRKVDGNNQHLAFISTDLPEENWPYPTSGWAWRDAFAQRLREYTEGLLYFAQNDDELPAWFKDGCRRWGWATDEYQNNGHFPRQIYVREGRRMKGKYFFTANDVMGQRRAGVDDAPEDGEDWPMNASAVNPLGVSTTITASHYSLDSHAARKREPGRVHLDGFFSYHVTPYSVPYGVMVPDAPITNLLCPVPVSASHVGFSTLRMEPCWMALGQAAGIAACLCLDSGAPAEFVNMDKLQLELLDEDAVLVYSRSLWGNGITQEDRKRMQWRWLTRIKQGQQRQTEIE